MRIPTLPKPSPGAAALFLLLLAGCGITSSGGACRLKSDCLPGLECAGPNEPRGCGIPARQDCAANSGCDPSERCHAIADSCSSTGIGSTCRAPCTAGCGPGFRCNAQGSCEPVPCDEGYTCPAHQRCDSAAAHATGAVYTVTQGCVNRQCTADSDCPATLSCVNSFCQVSQGVCQKAVAVP